MANVFEQLMLQNRKISEAEAPAKVVKDSVRKIPVSRIQVEGYKFLEAADLDFGKKFDNPFDNIGEEGEESSEVKDVVLVTVPSLDAEKELTDEERAEKAQEIIGKEVCMCPECGKLYVSEEETLKEEGIELNEDGIPDMCPICGGTSDQMLIGQISPSEDVKAEDETDLKPQGNDKEENDEEEPEEKEEKVEETEKEEVKEESVEVEACKSEEKPKEEEKKEELKEEEVKDESVEVNEAINEGVDEDHFSAETIKKLKDAGFAVVTDDEGKQHLMNQKDLPTEACHGKDCVNSDQKILQKPWKKKRAESYEFDEGCFENLMNDFLEENYNGDLECKLESVSINRNRELKLEYVIYNGDVAVKRGAFVTEGRFTRVSKVIDESCLFSDSRKPTFTLECVKEGNVITPVNLSYNFIKQVNESVYRVKGEHSID